MPIFDSSTQEAGGGLLGGVVSAIGAMSIRSLKMKRYMILILLLVVLTACAPDPRKEAQAFAIRTQAEQDALNADAQRQHAQEVHDIQVQQLELEEQHREATAQEWRNGLNRMLYYGFYVATAALCFMIFMGARSMTKSFAEMTEGISAAIVRAADVKANTIRLDPVTRQFPVYLQYLGAGRFSAVNFNTNSVLMLDTRNDPDRQMIAAMGAVQYAGALAREARQSEDPTGVALIQAPIVDVKDELLSLGKDLLRRTDE
jgi:hypothetical protein